MTARTEGSSQPTFVWVRRAVWLAYLTIAYNLVEGLVSIAFGVADESVALFGFGVDSFIEVASASLVLWRFQGEHRLRPPSGTDRERQAARSIGLLFLSLAFVTAGGAAWRLHIHAPPDSTLVGVIVSVLSLAFMFFLWAAKSRVADALQSATVRSDAACSMACIKLSVVLLVGSVLFAAVPALWWIDSVAAIVLAILIGREGSEIIAASRKPQFTGGCGCVH